MFLGLRKKTWLNDEVINFYMQMLIEREEAISSPQSLYLLSFFFSKLTGDDAGTITYNYANVERWTKKKNFLHALHILSYKLQKKSLESNIFNSRIQSYCYLRSVRTYEK